MRPLLDLLASWSHPQPASVLDARSGRGSSNATGAAVVATGLPTPTLWRVAPHVVAPVLRTLVNLTSNARIGNPVRQVRFREL